jgi:UDP-glucose 4-epimerase
MIDVNGSGEVVRRDFPPNRKAIDIGDYYADFSKIRLELGWTPKKPLRETIAKTLNYYREYLPKYL